MTFKFGGVHFAKLGKFWKFGVFLWQNLEKWVPIFEKVPRYGFLFWKKLPIDQEYGFWAVISDTSPTNTNQNTPWKNKIISLIFPLFSKFDIFFTSSFSSHFDPTGELFTHMYLLRGEKMQNFWPHPRYRMEWLQVATADWGIVQLWGETMFRNWTKCEKESLWSGRGPEKEGRGNIAERTTPHTSDMWMLPSKSVSKLQNGLHASVIETTRQTFQYELYNLCKVTLYIILEYFKNRILFAYCSRIFLIFNASYFNTNRSLIVKKTFKNGLESK